MNTTEKIKELVKAGYRSVIIDEDLDYQHLDRIIQKWRMYIQTKNDVVILKDAESDGVIFVTKTKDEFMWVDNFLIDTYDSCASNNCPIGEY